MSKRDSKNSEMKNKNKKLSEWLGDNFPNMFKGQKNEMDNKKRKLKQGSTLPKGSKKKSEKQNKEKLKELKRELKKLQEMYKAKSNEYKQVELEYLQYRKICERCIKPVQYLLGYCKYNASDEKNTFDLVKKLNQRYIDILIGNIGNCGITITKNEQDKKYKFTNNKKAFKEDHCEYNNFDFNAIDDFDELENEREDMKYRITKAQDDISFIKETYQHYHNLCKGVAPIIGKMFYYCRHDLECINDVISVSLELEKIMKEFTEKLRTYDIEIKYYEELQKDCVDLWFNTAEKGFNYPAVLKNSELFLDAYGQFAQRGGTNQ